MDSPTGGGQTGRCVIRRNLAHAKSQCLPKHVKYIHLAEDLKSETLGEYVELNELSIST